MFVSGTYLCIDDGGCAVYWRCITQVCVAVVCGGIWWYAVVVIAAYSVVGCDVIVRSHSGVGSSGGERLDFKIMFGP